MWSQRDKSVAPLSVSEARSSRGTVVALSSGLGAVFLVILSVGMLLIAFAI